MPVNVKWPSFPSCVAARARRSPLRGNEMAQWLHKALRRDGRGRKPSPCEQVARPPRGNRLDLFVTITDFYGYERYIALDWPKLVPDARHRHVLNFHYEHGEATTSSRDNGGLAFAARTTSSFPGGLSARQPRRRQRRAPARDLAQLRRRCFRIYELNGD